MLHPAVFDIPLCVVWIPASSLFICTHCFPELPRMPKPCCHGYYYSYSAEYQPHKTFISLVCLQPSYLQVCLPRSVHLLACVTSCLSHYLPVCKSVCPPASAPQLSISKHFISGGKPREQWSLWKPDASLFGIHFPQNNTIYYPSGRFYILCLSFLLHCFLSQPPVVLQFTGRQEGWLLTAVRLPKLTASKDERPPLIALPGLLLSKQFPSHPLRKCVQCSLQSCQLHSSIIMEEWLLGLFEIQLSFIIMFLCGWI